MAERGRAAKRPLYDAANGLAAAAFVCYHAFPRRKRAVVFNAAAVFDEGVLKSTKQKEVDEHRETLHNLSSLLLTNKTIRRMQQGSTEYDL